MTDENTDAAISRIEEQIRVLQNTLDQVLDARRENEKAVGESRKRTQELLRKGSEIAAEEGRLRKEVSDLETALRGLKR